MLWFHLFVHNLFQLWIVGVPSAPIAKVMDIPLNVIGWGCGGCAETFSQASNSSAVPLKASISTPAAPTPYCLLTGFPYCIKKQPGEMSFGLFTGLLIVFY